MIPCRAGVLLFSFFVSFVVCAGETVQVAGVPLEETYRAFEPDNGWTRIDYVLRPTKESFIRCRLILPSKEKWTGRFWGLGNGSEGGKVWHEPSFARRGDASVLCDLGTSERRHYRYPSAFDDYGWRATHLMTVTGKALTERFYGRKIKRSYFHGGSTGGNQGMREAMDFPDDYDGIVVDVPAQARVSMCALYWWIGRAIRDDAGQVVVSTNQCVAMARAAVDWFSDKDEPYARGKFLTDPRYSPEAEEGIYALASKSCAELTLPGMRERWHRIFTGPVINGRRAHAGFPFGADLSGLTRRFNYNLAWFVGRDCDQRTVGPEKIEEYARRFGPQVNAEKEDLSAFAARGGKLLVMPGLEDEYVPYTSALDWYERTAQRMGGLDRLREFCRLFLLPGRAHGRGRGMAQVHNVDNVLVDWVEKGIAPERLQSDDYPIAAYPDKIGGDAVSGWIVKPFGRLGFARTDTFYVHGRESVPGASVAPRRKQRSYDDTTWWDPYVENIADSDTYLRRKFRQDVTDKTTGLSQKALFGRFDEIVASGKATGESWRITKAKLFAAGVQEQSIDVSPLDWFPAIAVWDRLSLPIWKTTKTDRAKEVNAKMLPAWVMKEWYAGNAARDWNMWQDFDHSVPDWRVIMKLGFPGMKERLKKYAVKGDPFYDGLEIAVDAMLSGIDRFIAQGKRNLGEGERVKGKERLEKEIACLERLRNGPPQTAYDAMMFVWLYFFWSEHLDGIQCRSLTELDVFLTPYYDADIAAGRTTETEFREQLKHFLWQWGSVANYWNQPVGLGGTRKDGSSEFNHVSKIILEVMDECALATPKFLVKIAPNTPDWAFDKMLDMARRRRSISFIGEEPAARALKKWCNASDEDCRTMVVRGCYEFGLRDSVNGTGVGYVNLLKPIEKMLAEVAKESKEENVKGKGRRVEGQGEGVWENGERFEDFRDEYLRRLAHVADRCIAVAFEFEKVLPEVNPANLMTLSTEYALKTRRDGFANGCQRGNNTSILSVGLGTTVDALLAVKEIVYEKKELSLAELGRVMAANWEGYEPLRLRMLRSKRKWGNNDLEANALGAEIIGKYASHINGRPNSRGGIFMASGHSARQFVILGEKTGATPDGRKKGEEMSKNLSPTMGADTEGATALVNTLAVSDVTKLPADYPLDMMLHPSVCEGEKGLQVMKSLVRQYHKNGGSVIQFTVFSAEELRDAQAHPEKYENLQVRVCGWNVRWNDLSKAEQDAYIRRAENVMKGW